MCGTARLDLQIAELYRDLACEAIALQPDLKPSPCCGDSNRWVSIRVGAVAGLTVGMQAASTAVIGGQTERGQSYNSVWHCWLS